MVIPVSIYLIRPSGLGSIRSEEVLQVEVDDRAHPPREEAELTQRMLENPDLPVSFRDWLEKNESGAETGQRLERFGCFTVYNYFGDTRRS